MADGKNILLTHMERGLIQRMGQVLAEGRINPDYGDVHRQRHGQCHQGRDRRTREPSSIGCPA